MRITITDLENAYACGAGVKDAERVFPNGMEWGGEDLTIAIAEGLDVEWALDTLDLPPTDDTRKAAISGGRGYAYARYVDGCPRDDTREAAITERWAHEYARYVEE